MHRDVLKGASYTGNAAVAIALGAVGLILLASWLLTIVGVFALSAASVLLIGAFGPSLLPRRSEGHALRRGLRRLRVTAEAASAWAWPRC